MRSQITLSLLSSLLLLACSGGGSNIKAGAMPAEGTFTGVYFSQQYGEMNMIENGSSVVGEYKSEQRKGKIQGEADGDVLHFEWVEQKAMVSNRATETRGHGYFRYQIDPGNGQHLLVGEWGLGDDESGGGPWRAYKLKGKDPHLSTEDQSSGGESSDGESTDDSSSGGSDDQSTDDDLF